MTNLKAVMTHNPAPETMTFEVRTMSNSLCCVVRVDWDGDSAAITVEQSSNLIDGGDEVMVPVFALKAAYDKRAEHERCGESFEFLQDIFEYEGEIIFTV